MANRPHIIDGKTVDPKRAVPREQSQRSEANISSKRLYVSGVREEHTEDMFKEHFGKYGNILKVFFSMIIERGVRKRRWLLETFFQEFSVFSVVVALLPFRNHLLFVGGVSSDSQLLCKIC